MRVLIGPLVSFPVAMLQIVNNKADLQRLKMSVDALFLEEPETPKIDAITRDELENIYAVFGAHFYLFDAGPKMFEIALKEFQQFDKRLIWMVCMSMIDALPQSIVPTYQMIVASAKTQLAAEKIIAQRKVEIEKSIAEVKGLLGG